MIWKALYFTVVVVAGGLFGMSIWHFSHEIGNDATGAAIFLACIALNAHTVAANWKGLTE